MPPKEVNIFIHSNNSLLSTLLSENLFHENIRFVPEKKDQAAYAIFFVDLNEKIDSLSQNIFTVYENCRRHGTKLAIVLIHQEKIDSEKNLYLQNVLSDISHNKPLHRLIITKDIYQDISASPIAWFDTYLRHCLVHQKITISQKGNNQFYPLHLADLVNLVIKSLFLSNTAGRTFWALGEPVRDLDLAYLLRKNLQNVKKTDLEINALLPSDPQTLLPSAYINQAKAELNWVQEIEIDDRLRGLLENLSPEGDFLPTLPPQNVFFKKLLKRIFLQKPKPSPSKIKPAKKILLSLFVFFVAIYTLNTLVFLGSQFLSLHSLEASVNHLTDGNIQLSVKKLSASMKYGQIGDSTYPYLKPFIDLADPSLSTRINNLNSFASYTRSTLENLQQTYNLAEKVLLSLGDTKGSLNYKDTSLALHSNLSQIYENLNQVKVLSSSNKLPRFLEERFKSSQAYTKLPLLEDQVLQFIKITDLIPAFLGDYKTNNILVLLQNDHFLRSNGGELQSLFLLTLDQGHLISKQNYLPSSLDLLYVSTASAKKKTVNPRAVDLGNQPDFSQASQSLSSYLERTLKIKPDYVLALNNQLFEELLHQEDPTMLEVFKQKLNSTDSTEIQSDLFVKYLDKLFRHELKLPLLGRTVAKMIGNNQFYLWAQDSNTERLIASQSYSGIIQPHPCHRGLTTENLCYPETFFLAESLVDDLTPNPWIDRSLTHTVILQNGLVNHRYQIKYSFAQATSSATVLATSYHLYLPTGSDLSQLLLDGLPFPSKDVKKETSAFFDHYQIPMFFTTNEDHTVQINLTTVLPVNQSDTYSYSLTEYRQSGTKDSGINLVLQYPENYHPTVVTQPATSAPNSLNLVLPQHTATFGLSLTKNKH